MTTELEKQFFQYFGIEPKKVTIWNALPCYMSEEYPQITDRHYLELICISNKELIRRFDISGSDLVSIKKNILSQCIKDYTFYSNTLCETYNRLGENFKHQVQAMFEGER